MRTLLVISLLLVPAGLLPCPEARAADWRAKLDVELRGSLEQPGEREFLLFLADQRPAGPAPRARSRLERVAGVVADLRRRAERSQAGLRALLAARGVAHRGYWAANVLWVRGDTALLRELALRPEVARVLSNTAVSAELPEPLPAGALEPQLAQGVEWNLSLVGVPEVWALGLTGQGAVIAGADTGYQWDHPALRAQYRGWNGVVADHAYNWHDAIHTSLGPCGADSPDPCDDDDHGTHTMGTMVGDDGNGNQIGVAPGARWIGCRNMDAGVGTPTTYTECFQWFMAPTDAADANPDPARAPHVINNSWTCPPSEGCSDPVVLQTVVENVRAAGILVVAAAGNEGPSCATVSRPPAIYDASLTVAATNSADGAASFSSRGPVLVDGSGRAKPDVAAPGVGIRSSVVGGGYLSLSGTSMAGPHVVGLAALLISANPALAGDPDALESAILGAAVPLSNAQSCGGDVPGATPNHVFGAGRIDALGSVVATVSAVPGLVPGASWLLLVVLAGSGVRSVCRHMTRRQL